MHGAEAAGVDIKSCRETAIFPSVYLIEFAAAVNCVGGKKAGINLITDLCGWRWDFMARELSGKNLS